MAEEHLKMFNILTYQRNANQNDPEILPNTNQNGKDQNPRQQQMLTRMYIKRNIPPLLVEFQVGTVWKSI